MSGGVAMEETCPAVDLVEEGGAQEGEVSQGDASFLGHPVWEEEARGVQALQEIPTLSQS